MSDGRQLRLIVPGLLGPLPRVANPERLPRLPALEVILGRGRMTALSVRTSSPVLIQSQFVAAPSQCLPAGPVAALGDGIEAGEGYWFCADPVHLHADLDRLTLMSEPDLITSPDEAASFIAELNEFLRDDGMRLEYGAPTRWYLHCVEAPNLTTTPTIEVKGHSVGDSLPSGPDAGRWARLQSELQMLLHSSAANRERTSRGLVPVNALWLWGGGRLADAKAEPYWTDVLTDDPLAGGWARLAAATVRGAATGFENVGQRVLGVDCRLDDVVAGGDVYRAWQGLERLEAEWFAPALAALQAGEFDSLELQTGSVRCSLRRSDRWRVWRRLKPLHETMEEQGRL
ncbi:hypothetical protein CAI21_13215 [Alkalilimnicola ehrlichii]|uniref:Regulatory protein, RpfE type n=1 Tax=Alkalilimnicola ehrlichii TaxID=351052 RepID=A0A3E0WPJ2_9GAMM|nr:hypothetical protein [Alkalilimnicola ehrlichii]RFA28272.1 hypothetical protein CAI21_13215 [Alkalilimnicola ehrlichii]RFA34872.1 hypothetical protein CAL65_14350 [Alkalilimnicola ehrlichii]